jgi:hypothetical protein
MMIHLRCHKKKWKRCRNESTLLPVNGTYTCGRDTTFVSQHINTLTLNMTTTADAALFIPRGQVARNIFGVICVKAAVILCRRSASFCGLCPYTSHLTYPHMKKSGGVKSGEFAGRGMGTSRPHQWLFHVSSKNSCDFRGLWIMTCRMSFSPHSSACVRHSQTIFQEVVPFHNVPMWRDVVTIVLASKSSLGPCNTRKFRIPYDALCSLLRCDHHVCLLR